MWLGDGASYRRSDVEPALRSTSVDLTSPSAIAVRGADFVVAGSTTHLGGGRITVHASAFWTTGLRSPWRRVLLPSFESDSTARDVACLGTVCTIVGDDGGKLAIWQLAPDGRAERVQLGHLAVPVPSTDSAVAAVAGSEAVWVLASATCCGCAVATSASSVRRRGGGRPSPPADGGSSPSPKTGGLQVATPP